MKTKNTRQILDKSKAEEIKSLANKIVKSKKHCNDVLRVFEFLTEVSNNIEFNSTATTTTIVVLTSVNIDTLMSSRWNKGECLICL